MIQKLSDVVLEFRGPDARQVLHGQTTRQFLSTPTGSSLDGAFCDLKGRVIADFCALIIDDDHILLRTDDGVGKHLQAHLKKYLMFSKTQLTQLEWSCWAFKTDPPMSAMAINEHAVTVPRADGYAECWSESDVAPEGAIGAEDWQAQRLQTGDPRLCSVTSGCYLPQDLNYDLVGRIDFDKGCYTGQEIIARLHYRGKPKRRLNLLSLPRDAAVEPGDRVVDRVSEKTLGSVVECVALASQWLCLCETLTDLEDHSPSIGEQPATIRSIKTAS